MQPGPGGVPQLPEEKLAEAALRSGKVTLDQIAEARELIGKMRELGVERDLLGALVDREALTAGAAEEIRRAAAQGGGLLDKHHVVQRAEPVTPSATALDGQIDLAVEEAIPIAGPVDDDKRHPCANHPQQTAVGICRHCSKPICSRCVVRTDQGVFCSQTCLFGWEQELSARHQSRTAQTTRALLRGRLLLLAGVVTAVLVLGWGVKYLVDDHKFASWLDRSQRKDVTLKERVALLRKAVGVRPRNVKARLAFGKLLFETGEMGLAIEELTAALELDPENTEALRAIADAYMAKSMHDKAASALERLRKAGTGTYDVGRRLGVIYMEHLDRPEDAITAFRSALAAGGESRELRHMIGRALLDMGRFAEARPELERSVAPVSKGEGATVSREQAFLANGKKVAEVHATLATIAEKEKDADAELEHLRRAHSADPGNVVVLKRRVDILLKDEHLGRALEAAMASKVHLSGNAKYLLLLGGLQEKAGLAKARLVTVRKLYRIAPDTPGVLEDFIEAEVAVGNVVAARRLLDAVPGESRYGKRFADSWAAIAAGEVAKGRFDEAQRILDKLDPAAGKVAREPARPPRPAPRPRQAPRRPAPKPSALADIMEEMNRSVVMVRGKRGHGSGLLVRAPGGRAWYVATNRHVIEGAQQLTVIGFRGKHKVRFHGARIHAVHKDADVALVAISPPPRGFKSATLGDPGKTRQGDEVFTYGSPGGVEADKVLEQTATNGIVSACGREISGQRCFQTTAAINPGNSGGPLFTRRGDVVGINTYGTSLRGANFAIDVSYLHELLKGRNAIPQKEATALLRRADPLGALRRRALVVGASVRQPVTKLLVDPERKKLLAFTREENSVFVYDTTGLKEMGKLFVGSNPVDFDYDVKTGLAVVALATPPKVAVFDLEKMARVTIAPTKRVRAIRWLGTRRAVVVRQDTIPALRLYAVSAGGSSDLADLPALDVVRVSILNTSTGRFVGNFKNAVLRKEARDVRGRIDSLGRRMRFGSRAAATAVGKYLNMLKVRLKALETAFRSPALSVTPDGQALIVVEPREDGWAVFKMRTNVTFGVPRLFDGKVNLFSPRGQGHDDPALHRAAFDREGKRFAFGDGVCDMKGARVVGNVKHVAEVHKASRELCCIFEVSPDGSLGFTGTHIFSLKTFVPVAELPLKSSVMALGPEGKILYAYDPDRRAIVALNVEKLLQP